MAYVDYKHVRANTDIVAVAEWLGLKMKKTGEQYRAECPINGGDRSLVITPSKQLFHCFAPDCMAGGDCLQLVAKVRQINVREAALKIQGHFLDPHKVVGTIDNPLHKIDYLDPEHPLVEELGIAKADAVALGIGYAPKGTMVKRVLFPLRDERGKLVGYIGVNPQLDPPVKLPSKLHV